MLEKKAKQLLEQSKITVNGKEPWDIQVHDTSIYRDGILFGSLGFADGYTNGKWDVEQLDVFFEKFLSSIEVSRKNFVDIMQDVRNAVINTQIGKRAFQVGHKHYDLGNEMYEYMLGESMGYSSGKYEHATDDLTKAQYNKFDSLCKKLQLKPGMKVLEIGSGWGTFARHAAQNYGVEVISLTISTEQKAFADERCKGLPVKFLLLDYQKLGKKYTNYFDRVVSIEMIEAVGKKNIGTYFSVIKRALKKDGLVGIQAIFGTRYDDAFLSTRIFPNGHVPTIQEITNGFGEAFRLKVWESFGSDYDKTLMAWDKNFTKNWQHIAKLTDANGAPLYDEKFYRMWHYYLMVCAASFRIGLNDVAQMVLSRPNTIYKSQ